jgi:putative redox protein
MGKERIKFTGWNDHLLAAELDTPDLIEMKYLALYAPCFTCTKNIKAAKYIAQQLNRNGIGLFRFDFTGLGESEGDFSNSNFSTNIQNIRLAYDYLNSRNLAPQLLIGHSLGGAAMLRVAMEFDSVKALVAIASPSFPNHLGHRLRRVKEDAEKNGFGSVNIGGMNFNLKKQFFDNLEENDKVTDLSKMTKPVLVMHSPDDDTIESKYTFDIFSRVSGQKSYITLNNFGHLMMKPEYGWKTANLIATWADMYI